jgi:hypothetical protein
VSTSTRTPQQRALNAAIEAAISYDGCMTLYSRAELARKLATAFRRLSVLAQSQGTHQTAPASAAVAPAKELTTE